MNPPLFQTPVCCCIPLRLQRSRSTPFSGEFVGCDDTLLSRQCELAICPGPSPAHSHTHMVREGHRECKNCRENYCLMCVSYKNDSTGGVCIACLMGATDSNDPILNLSEAKMREELSTQCLVPATASLSALQGLYTEYFIDMKIKNATGSRDPRLLEKVMFPKHPSTALRKDKGTLEFITDFDFRDGAHFSVTVNFR